MTTWLTLAQAAEYLKVSQPTLRRAVRSGRLAAYRVNGARVLRFRATDLDTYLQASAVRVREVA